MTFRKSAEILEGAVMGDVSEKHPKLYHYTTYAGFHAIMDSEKLRAKYFRDLNDTSEIFHMREKLQEILVPVVKREIQNQRRVLKKAIREFGSMNALAQHEAKAVLDAFFEVTFGNEERDAMFPPYVTSFCSHIDDNEYVKKNGLLSMWKGYGTDGGVALVFNTKKLEECLRKETEEYLYSFGGLGDVVYEDDEDAFKEEFGETIELLKEKAMLMLLDGDNFETGPDFIHKFISVSTRYKHQAFAEEREVRVSAAPWTDSQFEMAEAAEIGSKKKKLSISVDGSTYIELFDGRSVPRLPITGVIIGPHKDQEQRHKEIRRKLKNRRDIKVVSSETPYIPR